MHTVASLVQVAAGCIALGSPGRTTEQGEAHISNFLFGSGAANNARSGLRTTTYRLVFDQWIESRLLLCVKRHYHTPYWIEGFHLLNVGFFVRVMFSANYVSATNSLQEVEGKYWRSAWPCSFRDQATQQKTFLGMGSLPLVPGVW